MSGYFFYSAVIVNGFEGKFSETVITGVFPVKSNVINNDVTQLV